MSPWMGILVLCTIPGILATGIQIALLKRFGKQTAIGKIIVFYLSIFYGTLSLVKMILDGGQLTLPESFAEILPATYLHYLVPLIVLSIIIPFIVSFIFRSIDISNLLSLADSIIFGILAMGYIIIGRISNAFCVITMFVGTLTALGIILFYKGEISYCSVKDIKRRIEYVVPPTLLYVVTVVLSLPGTLFLNNYSEFMIIPSSFAKAICIGAIVSFVIIAGAGVLILTWRQLELFYTVLFAITLSGYIQSLVLNGHMISMDGGTQTWQGIQLWGDTLIWIILIGGIALLKIFVHKNVTKVYNAICIYLSLVQLVSLGYLAVATSMKDGGLTDTYANRILSTDGALELYPNNNVLVFILDAYDEQILEKILQEDEDFLSPLDGFTYYSNATSLYAFTEMSLPYMLTDVEWQYDMEKEEYIEYAYGNGHVLDDILDAGYDIDLYTHKNYISKSITDKLSNYIPYNLYCDTWGTVNLMLKCSKYQMAPFICKNQYWYTTSGITALTYDDGFIQWVTDNDLVFLNALKKNKLSVDQNADKTGNIKFYHMYGAHPPYRMTEDLNPTEERRDYAGMISQSKGSMKIVFEYINQLKSLGLYDDTTIIITADHGENYLYDPYRADILSDLELKNTTSPILLVKNAGEVWDGVKQSTAPVSHTELIASIIDAINPQITADYGSTLADIDESAERERIFISTRSDLPYVKVSITGNALDEENWKIVETIPLD